MLNFIVNPNAGSANGYRIWKRLERRLVRKKAEYQVFLTGARDEARDIAAELTAQAEADGQECCLVGVGGDGIMNEIVDGAKISDRLYLGFIPVGGHSDLARGLRLPGRLEACLDRILNPREIRMMDYGVLDFGGEIPTHRRFLVSCGCGFEADLRRVLRIHHEQSRFSGIPVIRSAADRAAFLQCLFGMKTVKGSILLDSARKIELNHMFLLSVLNQPTESGRRLAPGSSSMDGLLTITILHNGSRVRQIGALTMSGIRNPADQAGVRIYSCREVQVVLEEPMLLHADGENCGAGSEFVVRCVRQKLQFFS